MHVRPAVRHAAHLAEQLRPHVGNTGFWQHGEEPSLGCAGSVQHGTALVKMVWRFPLKVKMQSSNDTGRLYPREMKTCLHRRTCTAVVLLAAQAGNHSCVLHLHGKPLGSEKE